MRLFLKIIGVVMFGFLAIALVLYFNGVHHVDFDNRYYLFMLDANRKLSEWSWFKIPNIPDISFPTDVSLQGEFLVAVLNFFNFIFGAIIGLQNFIINCLNFIIDLLKFIVAIITVLFEDLPALLKPSENVSSSSVVLPII